MKMRMYYQQVSNGQMGRAVLLGHEGDYKHPYNYVLGGMLWGGGRAGYWDKFLALIDSVVSTAAETPQTIGYNDWMVEIMAEKVRIELLINDERQGEFPLKHVKRAVEGWKRFLEMPESPESEVIVDLDA